MSRRNALLLIALAAIVVIFLARGLPQRDRGIESGEETAAAERDAVLRTAEGPALAIPDAPEAPAPSKPAARGDVTVTVLGSAGMPLPNTYVALRAASRLVGKAVAADGKGRVVFLDVPLDGSHVASFYRSNPQVAPNNLVWDTLLPKDGGRAERKVTATAITYRALAGLPLTFMAVNAETGTDVSGAQVRWSGARHGDRSAWRPTPERFVTARALGNRWSSWKFAVEAPQGWVRWEAPSAAGGISRYAEALTFIYPLRREIRCTVNAHEADGAAADAKIRSAEIAGRRIESPTWKGDGRGQMDLEGVPFLRDELVEVSVSRRDDTGFERARAVIPDHPAARMTIDVVLPVSEPFVGPENNGTIGIGGGSSSSFRHRRRRPLANGLEVLVLRRDGSPAVGAKVSIPRKTLRTDASGRVHFALVVPGTITVKVRQVGLLPMQGEAKVTAKGVAQLTLQEAEGGTVELEVVDGEGRPLSFAHFGLVTPTRMPWVDMEGTTQRLDRFTSHLGRRTLRHIEAGKIELIVSWGSRRETLKDIVLTNGESTVLRVVLPRPGAPR